jgi:hypothetical protein
MLKAADAAMPLTSEPADPLKALPETTNADISSLKTPLALSTNVLAVIEPELPPVK